MTNHPEPNLRVGRIHGNNLIFTQSWLNQLGLLFCFVLVAAAVTYLTLEYPEYSTVPVELESGRFGFPVLALVPLVVLLKAAFRVHNERIVLAPEYMIHISGRLSWRERSIRLEYSRIQEIEIDQTIIQKLLALGDVVVIPIAGMSQTAIRMRGLRHPRAIKDILRQRQKDGPEH